MGTVRQSIVKASIHYGCMVDVCDLLLFGFDYMYI